MKTTNLSRTIKSAIGIITGELISVMIQFFMPTEFIKN